MKSLTRKEMEQGIRIIKQADRARRSYSVTRNGSGIDAAEDFVRIIDLDYVPTDYYVENIRNILKKCDGDGWATDVIDNCLCVAAYSKHIPIKKSYLTFMRWMDEIDVKYPITNFQSAFYCPLCKPPFLSGIDKIDVIDVALGEKIILSCLDFDKWLEIGRDMGVNCSWLNKKESAKHIKRGDARDLYKHNNRIIQITKANGYMYMGDAIPARIFFEFLKPISVMNLLNETSL